jgi:hypothetical protein
MKDESKLLGRSYSSFIPHPSSFGLLEHAAGFEPAISVLQTGALTRLGYACERQFRVPSFEFRVLAMRVSRLHQTRSVMQLPKGSVMQLLSQ